MSGFVGAGMQEYIELWDIGGNPRWKQARKVFYDNVDGMPTLLSE
jgi:hypothetical protein